MDFAAMIEMELNDDRLIAAVALSVTRHDSKNAVRDASFAFYVLQNGKGIALLAEMQETSAGTDTVPEALVAGMTEATQDVLAKGRAAIRENAPEGFSWDTDEALDEYCVSRHKDFEHIDNVLVAASTIMDAQQAAGSNKKDCGLCGAHRKDIAIALIACGLAVTPF